MAAERRHVSGSAAGEVYTHQRYLTNSMKFRGEPPNPEPEQSSHLNTLQVRLYISLFLPSSHYQGKSLSISLSFICPFNEYY